MTGPKVDDKSGPPECRFCKLSLHHSEESTLLLNLIASLVWVAPTTAEVEGVLQSFPKYVQIYVRSKNGKFPV